MFQIFHLFQTYVVIVLFECCKSRSGCRCGGRPSPRWLCCCPSSDMEKVSCCGPWCGEDEGRGCGNGLDGMPWRIGWDVQQDRIGWDVERDRGGRGSCIWRGRGISVRTDVAPGARWVRASELCQARATELCHAGARELRPNRCHVWTSGR